MFYFIGSFGGYFCKNLSAATAQRWKMDEAVRKKEVKVHIFIGNIVMNEHFLKKSFIFPKKIQ